MFVGQRCWDAIVVGAGPAGALAARQLARTGVQVLLVDQKTFPRWKVCGACVNQQALSVLHDVGLEQLVAGLSAVPIKTFQMWVAEKHASINLPGGIVVSRSQFDAALVEAARDAGVEFLPETRAVLGEAETSARFVELHHSGRSVVVKSQVVLAAGGLSSRFLAAAKPFSTKTYSKSRIGVGVVVCDESDRYLPGTIYMAVGRHGYVGIVRMEDGRLNIAAALNRWLVKQAGSVDAAVGEILLNAGLRLPICGDDLASGWTRDCDWQGTVMLTRRTSPIAHDRVFLLGDAAGYVEPFTGEGIAWALTSAQSVAPLAARVLVGWEPELAAEWTSLHRSIIGRQQWVCRAIAASLRHSLAVGGALRLLSWKPTLATPLIQRLNAPVSKDFSS